MTGDDEDWMEEHQVRRVTASDSFFLFFLFFFLETTDTSEHIAYDIDEAYFAIVTATSTR